MGILTEREKEILRRLREGKSVKDISKALKTPITSVSRSITSIKRKAQDIEADVGFLQEIGFLSIEKGHLTFISPDKDPKMLGKSK